jgi:hypothetical protein
MPARMHRMVWELYVSGEYKTRCECGWYGTQWPTERDAIDDWLDHIPVGIMVTLTSS